MGFKWEAEESKGERREGGRKEGRREGEIEAWRNGGT